MIICGKTSYTEGFTLRSTVQVGTIQGRAERVYAEVEPMQMRRNDWKVLAGILFGSAAVMFFACWGFAHALVVVAQRFGL